MESTIEASGKDVLFFYEIEKGQPATHDSPEYPDIVINLDWVHMIHSQEFNDSIYADLERIEAEILVDAEKQKAEDKYEQATKNLD